MKTRTRLWAVIGGAPARALARRLASNLPRDVHDGIEMVARGARPERDAAEFLARTRGALELAASLAPRGYAELRKDVRSIVLWPGSPPSRYHRFQLAVLVPDEVALGSDEVSYAAWLLYASGLAQGDEGGRARARELLASLDVEERERVAGWLAAAGEADVPG